MGWAILNRRHLERSQQMKTLTERPSHGHETGRPVTPLEAKTQEIINRAVETGLESRGMLPDAASLPTAEESIKAVSKIDFSFNARNVRDTKTCQETAEMIAETLAPSIEMAHSILVAPDFYRPLDQAGLLFTRPFEAQHLPTDERIICGGEGGRQPQERHFVGYDEHNRPTTHVIGKRLAADGLPAFIEFYAWAYAPDSNDYTPLGGLHSLFCYRAEGGYTETWQEVSLYSLPACPKLKNPAEELYRLADAKTQKERFFLRVIDGRLIVVSAGGDSPRIGEKSLDITYLTYWHHRPSIQFGMYEGLRTSEARYGFDVSERTDGSWMYEHCEMNHPGFSCPEFPDACKHPRAT